EAAPELVQRRLLVKGEDTVAPSPRLRLSDSLIGVVRPGITPTTRGQKAVRVVVVQKRERQLLDVVLAVGGSCRLSRRLDGRQQKRHQNPDDCDHNQELNQGKAPASDSSRLHHTTPSWDSDKCRSNHPVRAGQSPC